MPDDGHAPIHLPHDKFFKENFSRLEVARDFFQHYLTPAIVEATDWATLRLEPGHFVDERLTVQSSDLLFSVCIAGTSARLYLLFEHQSKVEVLLRFRLLQYEVRIWEQWLKSAVQPDSEGWKLPPILPFVLYQGEAGWRVSTQFMDLVALPEALRAELGRYQPSFEHALLDLHRLPLEEIRGGLVSQLLLTAMKAVSAGTIFEWCERSGPQLVDLLAQPDQASLLRTLLLYLTQADARVTASTIQEMAAKLPPSVVKSDIMTIAEALVQEGRQEGWNQGLERGALIGRIQGCEDLLELPVTPTAELGREETAALEAKWRALERQLRSRLFPD